jgi:hypothetical protein
MIGRIARTVLRRSRQKVRPPRKICPLCFEADHIGGHNHIGHLTVEVCQFHHSLLTEQRLAAGAEMKKQPHALKCVEMALRSLTVTGHAIAVAVNSLCDGMEFCAEKLKAVYDKRAQR